MPSYPAISGVTDQTKVRIALVQGEQIVSAPMDGVGYQPLIGDTLTITSTDAGATVGPVLTLYRNSATPAVSDIIGKVSFDGEDSAGNQQEYASIFITINDPTSASEDSTITIRNIVAGTLTAQAQITGTGFQIPAIGATTPGTGAFTTLSSTGVTTLQGSITNDAAAAGKIGEFVTSTIVSGSAVALTTATAKNVTSISLTAGDWDVWGNVAYFPAATTSLTSVNESISQTTDTLDGAPGSFAGDTFPAIVLGAVNTAKVMPAIQTRISLASTTTVYLVARASFTVSTLGAFGVLSARRRR